MAGKFNSMTFAKPNSSERQDYMINKDINIKSIVLIMYMKSQELLTTAISEKRPDTYLSAAFVSAKLLFSIIRPFMHPKASADMDEIIARTKDNLEGSISRSIGESEKVEFINDITEMLSLISMSFDKMGIILEETTEEDING